MTCGASSARCADSGVRSSDWGRPDDPRARLPSGRVRRQNISIGVSLEFIAECGILGTLNDARNHQDDAASALSIDDEVASVTTEPTIASGIWALRYGSRIDRASHAPAPGLPESF